MHILILSILKHGVIFYLFVCIRVSVCVCVFMSVPHLMSNEQAFLIYIHLIPNNFTNIIKFVGLTHTFFSLLFIANLSALKMYSIYTTTIFCFFFFKLLFRKCKSEFIGIFSWIFPTRKLCVCSVVSNSWQPHGLESVRLLCP